MQNNQKFTFPSKEFIKSIVDGVRYHAITCEFCGREHYSVAEPGNYELGELEKLEENKEKNPDKYLKHEEGIDWGIFNGKQVVIGCPCNNLLTKYEQFIWGNRGVIARYLENKADKINELSKTETKRSISVKKSIEKLASS